MGVLFVLRCKDCNRMVDLNKNKAISSLWCGHPTDELGDRDIPIRFMRKHWGHDVDLHSSEDSDNWYGYSFNYDEEFK